MISNKGIKKIKRTFKSRLIHPDLWSIKRWSSKSGWLRLKLRSIDSHIQDLEQINSLDERPIGVEQELEEIIREKHELKKELNRINLMKIK